MVERLTYSVSEAAEAIGISRSKIYSLLAGGELRSIHIGRRTLVPVQVVLEFLGVDATPPESTTSVPVRSQTYMVTITPVSESWRKSPAIY